MKRKPHLDDILSQWAFDPTTLNVRLAKGSDGRDVIQMRVDMGILQLETTGRPDGTTYREHESVLEYLQTDRLALPERKLTDDEVFRRGPRIHAVSTIDACAGYDCNTTTAP